MRRRQVDPGALAAPERRTHRVQPIRPRFWLHATGPGVMFDGYDAGVSFRTVHEPHPRCHRQLTDGEWPLTRALDYDLLGWQRKAGSQRRSLSDSHDNRAPVGGLLCTSGCGG